MPKKPRKSRAKRKVRNRHKLLTIEEAGQHQETLAASSQEIPVTKPSMVTTEQERRHEHFLTSDLRRTFLAAGIALAVLIVLYLFLR
jgi:hypothetical protein